MEPNGVRKESAIPVTAEVIDLTLVHSESERQVADEKKAEPAKQGDDTEQPGQQEPQGSNPPNSLTRLSPLPQQDDLEAARWSRETRSFKGSITIDSPQVAVATAQRAERDLPIVNGREEIIFSCDGSLQYKPDFNHEGVARGYAVVMKLAPWSKATNIISLPEFDYEREEYSTAKAFSIQHMELAGLAQSICKAVLISNTPRPNGATSRRFRIFSDSQNSLDRINAGIVGTKRFLSYHTRPLVRAIASMSHQINGNGDELELHWVPRNPTTGLELADLGAGMRKTTISATGSLSSIADRLHSQVRAELQAAVAQNVLSRRKEITRVRRLNMLRLQQREGQLTTERARDLATLEEMIGHQYPPSP